MKKLGLILLLAIMLMGCGSTTPTPAPTPLEVFEISVVTKQIGFIQGDGVVAQQSFYKDYCERYEVIEVSYDVRETDSLVTPLTGYVVYTYHRRGQFNDWSRTVTLHYSYQGGAWVYKSMELSAYDMKGTDAVCKIVIGE